MPKPNREYLKIRLPSELLSELRREADVRGCTLTAVIEERLTGTQPLHDKLDAILVILAPQIDR